VAGLDRGQAALVPEYLEDWGDENNSVRAVDVFVEALDLRDLTEEDRRKTNPVVRTTGFFRASRRGRPSRRTS
jgi:transposase